MIKFNLSIVAIVIFLMLFIIPLFTNTYAQGNYKVVPILLIPANLKADYTEEKINAVKGVINQALEEIKSYYKNQTKGLEFNYAFDGLVIYISPKNIEPEDKDMGSILHRFRDSNLDQILRPREGITNLIFFVGSGDACCFAGYIGGKDAARYFGTPEAKDYGYIIVNGDLYEGLFSDAIKEKRNKSIGPIAHELGHAFGLVGGEYAWSHPCSEVSYKQECKIKNGLYPPASEYEKGLMGVGSWEYPNTHLNNTLYNPEKNNLYSSLYTNPGGLKSPFQIENTTPQGNPIKNIADISPKEVEYRGILNISGFGFGTRNINQPNIQDYLRFYAIDNNTIDFNKTLSKDEYSIINWTDLSISVRMKHPSNENSIWAIEITNPSNEKIMSGRDLQLKLKASGNLNKNGFITAQAVCGTENTPLKKMLMAVYRVKGNESVNIISAWTREDGTAEFILNLNDFDGSFKYIITAPDSPYVPSPRIHELDIPPNPTIFETKVSFKYDQCLPDNIGIPNPPDQKKIQYIKLTSSNSDQYLGTEFQQIDLRNFGAQEGQRLTIEIPVVIYYDDGTSEQKIVKFNYNGGSDGGGQSCSVDDRIFAGCVANTCGREYLACPNNPNDRIEANSPQDGDCRKPEKNPRCGGGSCSEQDRDYTQCGGECNGQRYNSSNTIEVKKRVSDSCQVSYQCRDLGKKPGECGNSSCQVINTYDECGGSNDCTPKDKILYEVKEYNGESCGSHGRFRCREKGYVAGKCDVPKCDEDKTYCDDSKEIHKHGGYYDPGSGDADSDGCVYAFDETGESC